MNKHVYDTKARHKQTGSGPDSSLLSSRIELKFPDTWTTTPAFFRPPSAALCSLSFFSLAVVLHRCGEYDRCIRADSPLTLPSDYRRLYPGTGVADVPVSVRDGSPPWPRWLAPAISCRAHWQQRRRPTPSICQEAPLGPVFGPISGVWADPVAAARAFPQAVSAACQCHWTWPRSSHSSTSIAHSFSNNPVSTHF